MRFSHAAIGAFALLASAGCGIFSPPQTVASVDVNRYLGRWYEIAKYPVPFEIGCFGVTADYSQNDNGTIRVLNTCREGALDGPARTIEGSASVTDPATNAQLAVVFPFLGIPGPYWIVLLDDDYQYAAVSDPFRLTLWILSRTPTLEDSTYQSILAALQDNGFDTSRLELMPQPPAD